MKSMSLQSKRGKNDKEDEEGATIEPEPKLKEQRFIRRQEKPNFGPSFSLSDDSRERRLWISETGITCLTLLLNLLFMKKPCEASRVFKKEEQHEIMKHTYSGK